MKVYGITFSAEKYEERTVNGGGKSLAMKGKVHLGVVESWNLEHVSCIPSAQMPFFISSCTV